MVILLVRHAHAGSKGCAGEDDGRRPLSARGRAEAEVLVGTLGDFGPVRIISSPLVRCLQTVELLAEQTGIALEQSDDLRPDAGETATALLHEVGKQAGPAVLCTHGEVIEEIQSRLRSKAPRNFSRPAVREKASVWVLHYSAGRITSANYLPPPP